MGLIVHAIEWYDHYQVVISIPTHTSSPVTRYSLSSKQHIKKVPLAFSQPILSIQRQ